MAKEQFTTDQLDDWAIYEAVRADGSYNMFDPRARRLTGLSGEKYSFVMENYSALKSAVEARSATNESIQARRNRCRDILRDAGCRLINACDGPTSAVKSRLEFWQAPRGLVIVQFWEDGGCSTFADWPLGETWDDLKLSLLVAGDVKSVTQKGKS